MIRTIWSGWLVLSALVLLAGCATYVNIPPQSGDVAGHDPNGDTVLKVELQALRKLEEDRAPTKVYRVVLPLGTSGASYDAVVPQISAMATWGGAAATQPTTSDAALPIVEVRQLRIRGNFAQADIIRPTDQAQADSFRQLVTVSLKWDMVVGWHATRLRIWRGVSVDEALTTSIRQAEIDIKQ